MAIYPIFPGGKRKAFTMSYDDGWHQDIRLVELMNKYGIKGAFNLVSDDKKLDELGDAREVYRGHEVASHALTHAYLTRVSPDIATYEIIKDRENLEEYFGESVRGFAYPYGVYNDDVITILKNSGIKYARTIEQSKNFNMPDDWYRLNPTCSHRSPDLMSCCDRFLSGKPSFNQNYLFYVYGHSYELDINNGWEAIEELFKKVGGRDDVWYTTGIELYDYISAFKSLITSVNNKYIYNPTATDISLIYSERDFIYSAVTVEIKSGEKIRL